MDMPRHFDVVFDVRVFDLLICLISGGASLLKVGGIFER
jgi:hypothetical protein